MRNKYEMTPGIAQYHLPGLFEFYEFYKVFLPIFYDHREFFYEWCDIGSIYGAPSDCIWGGGRVGFGDDNAYEVINLMNEYHISSRLTFSNSRLKEEHLFDSKCNKLCRLFETTKVRSGIIVYSDLLLDYIKNNYPGFYFVSSTTKVLTKFEDFVKELKRDEFEYVVPDFRLNKSIDNLFNLPYELKGKVEFLCNECCSFDCKDRKACYENVSMKALSQDVTDHICKSKYASEGYVFSRAMKNEAFIGVNDIKNKYLPNGFTNYKIEGRSLGSALILEFILHYMTKPEHHLEVREKIYLNHSLDLF